MPLSLHDEITRKYYETTANRGTLPHVSIMTTVRTG